MPQPTPPRGPRTHLSTRSKARKRAVDILFEAELRGDDPLATLAVRTQDAAPPVRDFTATLVEGVIAQRADIDRRIADCLSRDWTLERMPRVDRAVARLAVFELEHTEIAPQVAISEAVALVEDLSTDESPAFVNGLLARVLESRP